MNEVAGGIPVPVPLLEENSFSFNLGAYDSLITDRTKLIILNSPSNPTGGVMPLTDLKHIAQTALEREIWIISDETWIMSRKGCPASLRYPVCKTKPLSWMAFQKPMP